MFQLSIVIYILFLLNDPSTYVFLGICILFLFVVFFLSECYQGVSLAECYIGEFSCWSFRANFLESFGVYIILSSNFLKSKDVHITKFCLLFFRGRISFLIFIFILPHKSKKTKPKKKRKRIRKLEMVSRIQARMKKQC